MCHVSGQLYKTFRTPSTDMWIKAKKSMDLFPRVPRIDAVLFIVQCHGLSHYKTSRPVECKMTTLVNNGSNVSTSHGCPRFLAMRSKFQGLTTTEEKALTLWWQLQMVRLLGQGACEAFVPIDNPPLSALFSILSASKDPQTVCGFRGAVVSNFPPPAIQGQLGV